MKKALLATTAVMLSAGVAAADVTISGYGRTGVIYYEDGIQTVGNNDSQVISRLRMNLDATTETDGGLEFGGRVRLQWDQGNATRGENASTNAGKLWITTQGLTVEIGNVDTAMDNVGLVYASELGYTDRSVGGNPLGSFFAYESSPYADDDRLGIGLRYSFDALTVRASYVDPSQSGALEATDGVDPDTGLPVELNQKEEFSIGADYKWNDRLELSAAASVNAAGWDGHDVFFVGARYAVMENARIGLNFYDNGDVGSIVGTDSSNADFVNVIDDLGNTVTLYGDYTLADGLTNIEAYVANNDGDWSQKETDIALGIGVNYDLGGARLGASLQRDYQERVSADMGVRFNF